MSPHRPTPILVLMVAWLCAVVAGCTVEQRQLEQDDSTSSSVSPPGATLLMHLNEAAGATSFADSSGSGKVASCPGSCPTAGVAGKLQTAIDLDGSSQYLQVAGFAGIEPTTSVAAGAFIKRSSYPNPALPLNGEEILSMGDSYVLEVRPDGSVRFFIYDGTTWHVVDSPGTNVVGTGFHHVLGQKTTSALEVWVDGVLRGSAPLSGSIGYNLGSSFVIGRHGNTAARYFKGTIDEVAVYDHALTATEIASLAQRGPALQVRLNEPVGSTSFADSSGSGKTATCSGATCPTAGVAGASGAAIQLDGASQYLHLAGFAAIKPTAAVAAGAFVKKTVLPNPALPLNGEEVVSMGDSYVLEVRPDGSVRFFVFDGTTWHVVDSPGTNVVDGSFHHVLGQKTASTLEVWIDGVLKGTASFSGSIGYNLGTDFVIGRHGKDAARYFKGVVDDVTVYDRALGVAEIAALAKLVCTPKTCAALGASCGSVADGCGGTLSCGSCGGGATCGGGGTPNVCGTPPLGKWITGVYAAQNGVQPAGSIPWSKITHAVHFAAGPGPNGTVSMLYLTPSEITSFVASRPAGKKALVVLSDGGGGSFANATSGSTLGTFVSNIAAFVNGNGYDGVDIDWEANVVVSQYAALLAGLRGALPGKVISIDVGNWSSLDAAAAQAQGSVDQINVMCYDMDNTGSYTWHNDALFQNGDTSKMTCDWRVRAFTNAGVQAAKIGIGIPYYGRIWTGTTAPLQSGGAMQSWIAYRSLVSDPQLWQNAYKHWDASYAADYLGVSPLDRFVSYNGVQSIQQTVSWVKTQGFGGVMVFTTDYEYIASASGDARYPLSTALFGAMSAP